MSDDFLVRQFESVGWLALPGNDSTQWRKALDALTIPLPDSLTNRTEWPGFHELDNGRAFMSLHFPMRDDDGSDRER